MARDGFKVFDSDLHVMEPVDLWRRHIAPRYRDQAPVGTNGYFLDGNLAHEGRIISPSGLSYEHDAHHLDTGTRHGRLDLMRAYDRRGWGPDVQLEAMDREGIDVAVLFPTRGLMACAKEYADDGLAAAIARAYNDWLAEFRAADPDRLLGAALLAPQDVAGAAAEARRARRELGFPAVFIRPNPVRGRNWNDPVYDPLWSVCEAEGLLVGFHEGFGALLPTAVAERFDGRHEDVWMTAHAAAHPVEMIYASLAMICGGVLERFPGLRVAFLEANCSWIPYWLWRLDEHYEKASAATRRRLPMRPSEYFARQCFASIEADETTAAPVVERIVDNVVFSTDFPHGDSAFPNAVATFLAQPLAPETKRKILWDNTARMYGLAPGT
ncbi:MAG: amidohydrolase family protein [Alphaproteobacteria bacterium]